MISLSVEAQAALAAGRFIMRTGVVFYFSETYAFWNGEGTFTYGGVDFKPGGSLLEIGDIAAVGDLSAEKVDITLRALPDAGLTPDVLATIESEPYHQKPMAVWQFIFDADTGALATALRHYSGYVDQIEHQDDAADYALVASCESRSRDLLKTGARVHTTADQDQISTGDLFFQHVSTTATVTRKWGKA